MGCEKPLSDAKEKIRWNTMKIVAREFTASPAELKQDNDAEQIPRTWIQFPVGSCIGGQPISQSCGGRSQQIIITCVPGDKYSSSHCVH